MKALTEIYTSTFYLLLQKLYCKHNFFCLKLQTFLAGKVTFKLKKNKKNHVGVFCLGHQVMSVLTFWVFSLSQDIYSSIH